MSNPSLHRRGYETWQDIADKMGASTCSSVEGCRKKWGNKYHEWGRVDQIGMIHWFGWTKKPHRKGLHRVMLWIAYGKNRQFREEPEWLGLYHAATWAYEAAFTTLDVRFSRTESARTRADVKALMFRDGILLKDYPSIRSWVNIPIRQDMLYSSQQRRLRSKVT